MIPPHELKNREFTRVMRGYAIPEVDEYISFVMPSECASFPSETSRAMFRSPCPEYASKL